MISLVEAIIIVIVILLVFMGLSSGMIIGLVLLINITITFVFMFFFQTALERISLGALIIALGMLVDNAIVITDGILVKMTKGENRRQAAIKVIVYRDLCLFRFKLDISCDVDTITLC